MPKYLDKDGLTEYTTKLTAKYKTIFADKADVGTPLVAATKSAMTDHDKIYVYTGSESGMTSGNWYYWNGTAWTSGGVYNSVAVQTDPSLTVANQAADAQAAGKVVVVNSDSVAATRINITTTGEDVVLAEMSDVDDLKSAKVPFPESPESKFGTSGQVLHTLGNGKTKWVDPALPTDEQTAAAVSDWLDDHPEATTTVQDHSLSRDKLVLGTLNFVTPEMYGAKGDGTTDDSAAWQDALDSGYPVKADNKQYRIDTTLEVPNGAEIDCNGASFLVYAQTLFLAENEAVASYTGSTYNINDYHYSLEGTYSTFSGLCVLIGTNNFPTDRTYYRGGFVARARNGHIDVNYPFTSVTPTVVLYNEYSFKIKNIGDVVFNTIRHARAIYAKYCNDVLIENCYAENFVGYSFVEVYRSCDCVIKNVNISQYNNDEETHIYPIILGESSECLIEGCVIYNRYWHCATTGGATDGLMCCYNRVINCKLVSDHHFAYDDHPNTIGTTVENSTVFGIVVCGNSTIENCVIMPHQVIDAANQDNFIRLQGASSPETANFYINNVVFHSPGTNYSGIKFYGGYTTHNNVIDTYYFDSVYISNVVSVGAPSSILFALIASGSYDLGSFQFSRLNNFTINSNIDGDYTVDTTDYIVSVENVQDVGTVIKGDYNVLNVSDSFVNYIRDGEITTLNISDTSFGTSLSGLTGTSLNGVNIGSDIADTVLSAFTNVCIFGLNRSGTIIDFIKTIDGKLEKVNIADANKNYGIIFDSGFISKYAFYNSSEKAIGDYFCMLSSGWVKQKATFVKGSGYIDLASQKTLGIVVDTDLCKQFFVKAIAKDSTNFRYAIKLIDTDGQEITDPTKITGLKNDAGTATALDYYTAGIATSNGCFKNTTQVTYGMYFTVPDNCAKIYIGIATNSGPHFDEFRLYGTEPAYVEPTGFPTILAAAPTCPGNDGDICYSSGSNVGWRYYNSQWNSF